MSRSTNNQKPKETTYPIESIQFGLLDLETILKMSFGETTESKIPKITASGEDETIGTLYDERFGHVYPSEEPCKFCKQNSENCTGHFSHISLVEPILSPHIEYQKVLVKILNSVCPNTSCNRMFLSQEQLEIEKIPSIRKEDRLREIQIISLKYEQCPHCGTDTSKYKLNIKHSIFTVKDEKKKKVSNTEIQTILNSISLEDCRKMGFSSTKEVRCLVVSAIPVSPVCVRPMIRGEKIRDDDMTLQFKDIISTNNKLKVLHRNGEGDVSKKENKEYRRLLNHLCCLIDCMYYNSKGEMNSKDRPKQCIKTTLSSKDGMIRNKAGGKRCDFSARSPIGPYLGLKLTECGVPQAIADILTVPVVVTEKNIAEIQEDIQQDKVNFIVRGKNEDRYKVNLISHNKSTPVLFGDVIIRGEKRIVIDRNVHTFYIKEGDQIERDGVLVPNVVYPKRQKIKIKVGDTVHRKLRNKDNVIINRHPSLHKGSMMAFHVLITPGNNIRLNLAVTKSFNADFDGDEMSLHVVQSHQAITETEELSSVKNFLVSPQTSGSNITIVQDSLLGMFLMTNGHKPVKPMNFMDILFHCSLHSNFRKRMKHIEAVMVREGVLPPLEKHSDVEKFKGVRKDLYIGKALVSFIFPPDFQFRGVNDAVPSEPEVVIVDGVLVKGALNKKNLSSSSKSFIRLICKEYGAERSCQFVDNVQFMSNQWLSYTGFSVGISDCLTGNPEMVKKVVRGAFVKAEQSEFNTANEDIKEARILMALNGARDVGLKLAKETLDSNNAFVNTIMSGSKGDFFNICQIMGLLGQQSIDGQRIPCLLNKGKRSLPHYPVEGMTTEEKFECRGFISNSFMHGLNPQEFFLHCISGRKGVIDTAINTAPSGYIQRKIIKCTEDIKVEYDGTTRDSCYMYETRYDGVGFDPEKAVNIGGELQCCDVDRLFDKVNSRYVETS